MEKFETVGLNQVTVQMHVAEILKHVSTLFSDILDACVYSLPVNESTDITSTAQMCK
jgi:hypothetical protein